MSSEDLLTFLFWLTGVGGAVIVYFLKQKDKKLNKIDNVENIIDERIIKSQQNQEVKLALIIENAIEKGNKPLNDLITKLDKKITINDRDTIELKEDVKNVPGQIQNAIDTHERIYHK